METNHFTFTSCKKCHAVNKVMTSKLNNSQGVCGKCGESLQFHGLVSEIDDAGFNSLIEKSTLPVVVDFWAPWCGPCKQFAPTFEAASKLSEGKMVFIKLNTENYPATSQKLNIRGIPTLVIFKNGKEVARESGAFPLEAFKGWIGRFY